jgi:hypothetical protein
MPDALIMFSILNTDEEIQWPGTIYDGDLEIPSVIMVPQHFPVNRRLSSPVFPITSQGEEMRLIIHIDRVE